MPKTKRRVSRDGAPNLAEALAGLEDGTYANANQASKATGTPVQTIYHRLNGGKSRRSANIHLQALTPAEELALVSYIQRVSAVGHPVRHDYLRELVEEIRKQRVQTEGKSVSPVSKHWVERFLKRHPVLESRVAKSIEAARVEVTKEQILAWFLDFKKTIDEYGIKDKNIYNMDETGTRVA